ncbi:serine protease [Rhodovulum sulfidophilum]|uniref:Trypsin-like peptidase domain-containing protein n=1 Tax=Rhodovulum visakhapatnamense TaxID=364297 RepID=A0ABS1RJ47_9RHOB|nr:trypsin-like peptidase domain-containing protein [Rhodovulum visakhapatnamense]MBL3570326.1 trypsin-like peptidase domain-containing protein [Rhodovulum visakhapatnamense]MBL3578922.1 trypsin-like peptidase domain-containing protein [Rhodovulum visakhapatnamense]OLS43767.1 serine protease [Rhodovulum sulfidophilum]
MTRFVTCLCLALTAAPLWAETRAPGSRAEIQLSFAPVVREAAPAVVNVFTSRTVADVPTPFAADPFFSDLFRNFGRAQPRVENALGSGVIVSPDGMVVSNYHVVGRADQIRVVLADRREFDAQVLLADEEADLAVLQLTGARDLPSLPLRDSDEIEVGDLVLAIGNPFGIGQTVSSGIVSGLARSGLSIGGGRGYFIQTDAAINPGNSGGALVDMAGRLVGINTAILSRSGGSNGIGFAIPANLVSRFIEQAQTGARRFQRPWAGLAGQPVDAGLAEALGMDTPRGVVLNELHPESPFRAAGLGVGDVVLSLGGDPVNTPQEMLFRLSAEGVGRQIEVSYLHQGDARPRTARVDLIAPPETPPRDPLTVRGQGVLAGLSVVNLNPAVLQENGLPSGLAGVLVTDPGSVGGRVGLAPGDILLQINDRPIATTADVARAAREGGRSWYVEYLRGGRRSVLRFRV